MKTLKETYVTTVCDPRLFAVEENGQNHGPIDQFLYLVLPVFFVPYTFVQYIN